MILHLLSSFGIAYFLKESYLFSFIRNYLMRSSVLFFNLFSCYFCLGFHTGWMEYLLTFQAFDVRTMLSYSFASAAVSMIINVFLELMFSTIFKNNKNNV